MNYTLAHLLHLTRPSEHFIATSLLATFRGFAGSFGSAIGGGVFSRVLSSSLEAGFKERGLTGKKELIRKLLGSPALVSSLNGYDRIVAVNGYVTALKSLFLAGCILSTIMIAVQAGTGWKGPDEKVAAGPAAEEEEVV